MNNVKRREVIDEFTAVLNEKNSRSRWKQQVFMCGDCLSTNVWGMYGEYEIKHNFPEDIDYEYEQDYNYCTDCDNDYIELLSIADKDELIKKLDDIYPIK